MLPHFYWKSNRARDRGTGLRPLPWPAPTHVNRNSFFRDSERVRIAAHLGLVEVNLGYLAQRCAGRLAGLLTSRLLHSFPLMRRSASRADDVDRVLGLLDEDNEQNTTLFGLTNQNRALRIQCVLHHRRERVSEHRSGLNERDSVLLQVRRGLLWVPREPRAETSVTHCRAHARGRPRYRNLVSRWSAAVEGAQGANRLRRPK